MELKNTFKKLQSITNQLDKQIKYLEYLLTGLDKITNKPVRNMLIEYTAYQVYLQIMKNQMDEVNIIMDKLKKINQMQQDNIIQDKVVAEINNKATS